MDKKGLVLLTKEALGLQTNVEAEGFLKEVDALFEALAHGLQAGEKVRVGSMISVEKKLVPAKEGKCAGKEYKTEEHCKIVIKPLTALKREAM